MGRIWYATTVPRSTAQHYSAITNDEQRVEAFAVGADGNLYWAFQPGGTEGFMLSEFVSLGSPDWTTLSTAALVGLGVNAAGIGGLPGGRVEAFVNSSSGFAHIWQATPGTQSLAGWSGWGSLPAPPAPYAIIDAVPFVAENQDGTLDVFAFGSAIWHIWQNTAAPWWQGAWQPLLEQPTPIQYVTGGAVGRNQNGTLEAFAMQSPFANAGGVEGSFPLWHDWQSAPNNDNGWSGAPAAIFSLGAPPLSGNVLAAPSSPSVAVNSDGRLEVFVGLIDGTVWHIWQTAPAGGWSGWNPLGIPTGAHIAPNLPCPAAILNPLTGFLEVYVVGDDGALWSNSQDPAGPGGWGGLAVARLAWGAICA